MIGRYLQRDRTWDDKAAEFSHYEQIINDFWFDVNQNSVEFVAGGYQIERKGCGGLQPRNPDPACITPLHSPY
jgi:hypothetical protein